MVSKQTTSNKPILNANAVSKPNNVHNLETEIKHVLHICKDMGKCNNKNLIQNRQSEKDQNSKSIQEQTKKNCDVTLEKVAQDMTFILKDLKNHLYTFKNKPDSFSDVIPLLEESLQNSNRGVENNQSFFKKMANKEPTDKSQKVANSSGSNSTQPVPKPALNSNLFKRSNNSDVSNKKNVTVSFAKKNQSTSLLSGSKAKVNFSTKSNFNKSKFPNHSNNNAAANNTKLKLSPTSKSYYKSGSTVKPELSSVAKTNLKYNTFTVIPHHSYSPLLNIQTEVQNAVVKKKIFTIKGSYPAVRQALLRRGWIEKMHISYIRTNENYKNYSTYTTHQLADLLWKKDIAEYCKKLIMTKLLQNYQVDFFWSCNWEVFKECPDNVKLTKVNRFKRGLFSYTSKLGLCDANKKAVWFKFPGVSNFNHPRTYSLAKTGDSPGFIKDFNRTAAMSLLKWIVKNSVTKEFKVLSPSGKVPIEVFDFAVNECYKFIKMAEHDDIDSDIKEAFDYEWNEFLEYFYKTVHIGNHFKQNDDVTEVDMVRKANFILNKLSKHWPCLEMDGVMNIWILKPTNGSQGIGIHCCRTLQYILKTIKANPNRRYIIQKYIERPLLIYETKFDIRQWFLISSADPLTIWMYKKCYIRFSSETYNLRKLHESIHLTNNSVQARYQKARRDIALPNYNMWDSLQFKNYLSDIGYADVFDSIIYPGMKECLTAAVLMYEDKLDKRKNSFELYGADFMLTEDFKPWLLEINANPALHSSTPVTAKLCPGVLEDTIKIVLDFEENKFASTGDYELIYKNHLPKEKNMKLHVKGTPVTNDYFYNAPLNEHKHFNEDTIAQNILRTDAADYVKYIGSGMRKTLEDLLEILKKEKQKRHERKHQSVTAISAHHIETKECQTEYKNPGPISLIELPLESGEILAIQNSQLVSMKTSVPVVEIKKFVTEENNGSEESGINEKKSSMESNKSYEIPKVKSEAGSLLTTTSNLSSSNSQEFEINKILGLLSGNDLDDCHHASNAHNKLKIKEYKGELENKSNNGKEEAKSTHQKQTAEHNFKMTNIKS